MFRFLKCCILLSFIFLLSSCTVDKDTNEIPESSKSTPRQETDLKKEYAAYNEAVRHFEISDTEAMLRKGNTELKFIYFGRPSCPYCRKFAPILKNLAEKNGKKIYYIDTDLYKDSKVVNNFLDKYSIDEVPTLIYINNDKVISKYKYDSDMSLENFLKKVG